MNRFTYSILFENNQLVGMFKTLESARLFAKACDEHSIARFKNNHDGSVNVFPAKFKEFKA